ncbi:hypothetical protein [Pseudomonas eucalypticola]|uniref:CDP-glycerol--glycerophosphate glycerophosphotransferase n=1 Tax=Pseudomonas eucalypticola TaxID=2599595 RepID=A0A7D5H7K9_9PSED|nr:hypothetical protein [Pseudomonas eucalypticola]QKZ06089.1 hypothetical protein HWQ56_20825 [Pseudomonas eucalypticola]
MSGKKVNYVYVSGENLRQLEEEFAAGITHELGDWSSSSTIVTTSPGDVNVTFFIYRRAHIMMSHGVADKNYLLRPDELGGLEVNKYRTVCVPGPWMKRKLLAHPGVELSEQQIKIVGWPRIDKLLAEQARQRTLSVPDAPTEGKKIKVLWAPTHGAANAKHVVSSYPSFLGYEEKLKELFDYDSSLHPNVRPSKTPTFQKLIDADVVIADRGTMVYEAWALGKPVIFPSWLIKKGNIKTCPGSAENHIFQEKIGLHARSFEELIGMIYTATKPDATVEAFMEDYLPAATHGKSYKLLANAVQEIWASNDLRIKKKVKAPEASLKA